jgi:hypothetical protein
MRRISCSFYSLNFFIKFFLLVFFSFPPLNFFFKMPACSRSLNFLPFSLWSVCVYKCVEWCCIVNVHEVKWETVCTGKKILLLSFFWMFSTSHNAGVKKRISLIKNCCKEGKKKNFLDEFLKTCCLMQVQKKDIGTFQNVPIPLRSSPSSASLPMRRIAGGFEFVPLFFFIHI